MQLTLQPEEAKLLKGVLINHLSNLRGEIADTDDYEWREALKRDEATIKMIISRLEGE